VALKNKTFTKMKNLPLLAASLMVAFMFTNCSEKKSESTPFGETSTDTVSAFTPADVGTPLTPENRKFIRSADVKFKVKNIQEASNAIEDLVNKYQGFTTTSEIHSNVLNINEVEISEDSILLNKSYEVSSEISIRIPNETFDKTLREIQPLIAFLDNKSVSAEDVSLSFMASELRKNRYAKFEKRYEKTIDAKGKKLAETASSEEKLFNHQSNADDNQMLTMQLKDKVNYSSITLHLYQPVTVVQEMLPNLKNTHAFMPNLFVRLWQSIRTGWYIFEEILVGVAQLWFVILIGFGGFWIYRRRKLA
jgi:PBP1b-binding outer membrane lipoprotein LpoB